MFLLLLMEAVESLSVTLVATARPGRDDVDTMDVCAARLHLLRDTSVMKMSR